MTVHTDMTSGDDEQREPFTGYLTNEQRRTISQVKSVINSDATGNSVNMLRDLYRILVEADLYIETLVWRTEQSAQRTNERSSEVRQRHYVTSTKLSEANNEIASLRRWIADLLAERGDDGN